MHRKGRLALNPRLLWYSFLAPAVVVLLAINIYPMLYSISVSFRSFNLTKPYLGNKFIGFDNYVGILSDGWFLKSVMNSLLFLLFIMPIELLVGLGVALLLNNIRTKAVWLSLVMVPMTMTPVIAALTWRFMYHPQYGILNYLLRSIGLPPQTWLAQPKLAFFSVMLVDIWQWTPFIILILTAGLASLPQEPQESARVDGASAWQMQRYVVLPMLRAHIGIALLLRTIDLLKLFDSVYILTSGGPGNATETVNTYVFKLGFKQFDIGKASAASYLILIIVITISTVLVRRLKLLGNDRGS